MSTESAEVFRPDKQRDIHPFVDLMAGERLMAGPGVRLAETEGYEVLGPDKG